MAGDPPGAGGGGPGGGNLAGPPHERTEVNAEGRHYADFAIDQVTCHDVRHGRQ